MSEIGNNITLLVFCMCFIILIALFIQYIGVKWFER